MKDKYSELNYSLNEIFNNINQRTPFIDQNILELIFINDAFTSMIRNYSFGETLDRNNLTYEEVIKISRKIVERINKEYLEDFDSLVPNGNFIVSDSYEFFDSHFAYYVEPRMKALNINRKFNYEDIMILIHEFMHYELYDIENSKENYELLTEFFSIYFEMKAYDYLMDLNVPKNEICRFKRLVSTAKEAEKIFPMSCPIIAFTQFGKVDDESFELIKEYFYKKLKINNFNHEVNYLSDYIDKEKKKHFPDEEWIAYDVVANDIIVSFKYIIGTILTFYARKYCKEENILKAYKNLNLNMGIDKILDDMGIQENINVVFSKGIEEIEGYLKSNEIEEKGKVK